MATVKQCDRCESVERVSTISVITGRRTDAAGSRKNTGITLDLCEECQAAKLRHLRKEEPGYDTRQNAAKFRRLCKEYPEVVEKVLKGINIHG